MTNEESKGRNNWGKKSQGRPHPEYINQVVTDMKCDSYWELKRKIKECEELLSTSCKLLTEG